jgi:hypothetical protein
MDKIKPKIQMTNDLIEKLAGNYARNFAKNITDGEELSALRRAVTYGLRIGLMSEEKIEETKV